MKAKIRQIVDHGHDSERVIIDITEDTDIGKFIVLDTTYTKSGSVSNKVRHPYWFPDQSVKKDDVVVLYTKAGKRYSKEVDDHIVYFFYWGLDINVWNNDGDSALLMHIDAWQHYKVTK
jgi:hypothetical protein